MMIMNDIPIHIDGFKKRIVVMGVEILFCIIHYYSTS